MKKPCSSCKNAYKTSYCPKRQRYEPNWFCEKYRNCEIIKEYERKKLLYD